MESYRGGRGGRWVRISAYCSRLAPRSDRLRIGRGSAPKPPPSCASTCSAYFSNKKSAKKLNLKSFQKQEMTRRHFTGRRDGKPAANTVRFYFGHPSHFYLIFMKCTPRALRCAARRCFEVRWKVPTLAHRTEGQTSKSDRLGPVSSRLNSGDFYQLISNFVLH